MGLVIASATIDLDGFSPVRSAEPRHEGRDGFSNVLASQLAPGAAGDEPANGNTLFARQGLAGALPGEDPETEPAATEETQLPSAVAAWLAISPLFATTGEPGSPVSEAGAAEVQASLLEEPAPGEALSAAVTGEVPPATLPDEMGVDPAVGEVAESAATTPEMPGEIAGPTGDSLPPEAAPSTEGPLAEDPGASAAIDPIEVESPPETSAEIAPPAGAVGDEAEDMLPPPAAEPAAEGMPAPGRHVEQSNRPANLPAGAAEQAVEALQRVAEKHQEAGKAPPGHSPGGHGMPAIAASVVRPVGNAETDTAADPGTPGDQGGGAPTDGPIAAKGTGGPIATLAAAGTAPAIAVDGAVEAAPAPPSALTAPEPPIDQVGRVVIEQVSEGGGEVRIRLDPPELGEVAIRVRIENHQVRVDIRVERPEALQLLRSAQLDLSSLLGDRGLNLSDMFTTLDQGRRSWGGDPDAEGWAPSPDEGFAAVLGIDDVPVALNHHRKLQGAYNPDGAYIYRV